MSSRTLSIRRPASVALPPRAPFRASASAAAAAIMSRPCRPARLPAAPVLPASIANTIRDGVSSQSFIDTFDALLDRQDEQDASAKVRPTDRAVLRTLLTYRWCGTPPTIMEIAQRLGRRIAYVKESLARLEQCALLPCGKSQ